MGGLFSSFRVDGYANVSARTVQSSDVKSLGRLHLDMSAHHRDHMARTDTPAHRTCSQIFRVADKLRLCCTTERRHRSTSKFHSAAYADMGRSSLARPSPIAPAW